MALKTRLSDFSRQKLVETLNLAWFQEMLEVLRNTGSFAEMPYSSARPLSEMEHQALNSSYRRGALTIVERISDLAQPPKEKPEESPEPFGKLLPQTKDPKSLSQVPKTPQPAKA